MQPASESSVMDLVKEVTMELKNRVCKDPKWLFLFFSISNMYLIAYLSTTFLILWIHSFIEKG